MAEIKVDTDTMKTKISDIDRCGYNATVYFRRAFKIFAELKNNWSGYRFDNLTAYIDNTLVESVNGAIKAMDNSVNNLYNILSNYLLADEQGTTYSHGSTVIENMGGMINKLNTMTNNFFASAGLTETKYERRIYNGVSTVGTSGGGIKFEEDALNQKKGAIETAVAGVLEALDVIKTDAGTILGIWERGCS